MDWLIRQLALLYILESRALRQEVERSRDEMRAHLSAVFDATTDDTGEWKADDVRFRQRMDELQTILVALLIALSQREMETMLAHEVAAYRLGYYGTAWQMNAGTLPMLYDPELRAILNEPYIDATLGQRMLDLRVEMEQRARRTWVQSQTESDNLTQALRRFDELWGFKRGATKGYWFRLGVLSENELWRAANLGGLATMQSNAGMLAGKQWFTQEDERVCERCDALDGVIAKADKPFRDRVGDVAVDAPPLHARCRCFIMPVMLNQFRQTQRYAEWAQDRRIEPSDDGRIYLE